ncbi:hypothetical protein GCM10008171_04550 [Methylopila jiangsuensis]|uniref:Uncharacterized protein n=1 Tax=Methylopila jiangsuensis TaxID=586230 RepID=A0A9W6JEY9_9HYPH|nr:hypothetical protein [Methylopila jiangsuensis]MDR6285443.1 hypothetical protein [Methylopila jiangsuensis]GLK75201.1 hypothetical protein GCM10008171_04550 [Methylopila jiangsuensis]
MTGKLALSLSEQEAELLTQALDVYAATLMCAPLGLGLDLIVTVRGLRERVETSVDRHQAAQDAGLAQGGNVVAFARGA